MEFDEHIVARCIISDYLIYIMAGKFDKFGKSSAIHQPKTIQISSYN